MKGSIVFSTNDKGGSRGNAAQLADYLSKGELIDIRGCLAEDLPGAFAEMDAVAKGSRCKDFLYHFQINPSPGVHLTPEQFKRCVEASEKALGLEEADHVVTREFDDKGREHYHVVCSRVQLNEDGKLRAVNMGNDALKRQQCAVELEQEFGLEGLENRPLLSHVRGERALPGWEYQQGKRSGLDPRAMKAEVKALREASGSGKEFAAALTQHGYTLAQGDRRDFIIIDSAGDAHSLGKYAGMKAPELRAFMQDIDRAKLPTENQVKEAEREGVAFHHTPEAPHTRSAGEIFNAFQNSENAAEFAYALSTQNIYLAKVTAEDVQRAEVARATAQEAGVTRLPPQLREGDLVAVNRFGNVLKLNSRTTGASAQEIERKTTDLADYAHGSVAEAREYGNHLATDKAAEKLLQREERRAAREAEFKRTHKQATKPRAIGAAAIDTPKLAVKGVAKVADRAIDTLEGVLDFLCGAPAPRKITWAEYSASVEARQEANMQKAAAARRDEALERIAEDVRDGRRLELADIVQLSQTDAALIKAHGLDDGVRALIEERDRAQARKEDHALGRHRQR